MSPRRSRPRRSRRKRHQVWTDPCYAGSLATAGGLVFVGRNDGRITALDSSNGSKLWEFQTDGGVNAAPTMFAYKGKPYLLVYAGGAALGGSKRSDGVWLFSLSGTINSLPKGSADPAARAGPPPGPPPPHVADLADGKTIYSATCVVCHGETGQGGVHGGPPLTKALTREVITNMVTHGKGDMPPFGAEMSPDQMSDLAAYVLSIAK